MNRFLSPFLRVFHVPTPLSVAQDELSYAELELLKAQSQVEHSIAMLSYQTARVTRLRKFVAEATGVAAGAALRAVK